DLSRETVELLTRLVHHYTVGDLCDDECSGEPLDSPLPDAFKELQTLLPKRASAPSQDKDVCVDKDRRSVRQLRKGFHSSRFHSAIDADIASSSASSSGS